ncbi:MAG: thioredoxin-disulfide reductase [Candidatus Omnitrophica bacterium]|nr:thioredoxin-disulfide reductase [Candidatus Omnitrophota bacterium]
MYDLIIIGAGPAGLTAGLYCGRYKLNTLILEKVSCGGQIVLSSGIENFPGFPGGISTQELIERFKKQVDLLGVNIVSEEVSAIEKGSGNYLVRTESNIYPVKTIIIACGALPQRLGVKGEEVLIGRGVSYCATCDGPLFKNKEIVVVGGGDKALEEAIFLTKYAKKVTIIHRRKEFRAAGVLQDKAKNNHGIEFIMDTVVEEISGENKVEKIKIKDIIKNTKSELACQGVFIFAGITPGTGFLKNQLNLNQLGFIITDENLKTSLEGVFACGDCRQKELYQVINACSEGAEAAYAAQKYLLEKK